VPSDVGNVIGWEEKLVASHQSLLVGSIQERFLSAQANHSFGNEWKEEALACFVGMTMRQCGELAADADGGEA
jgi:hypothetical protein